MTTMMNDLVSTIIPVYNRPEMLMRSVRSVLAQTWKPIEIIISDDGSVDGTTELGRQLDRDYRGVITYIWNANSGPGPAREAGRKLARGEFIQYLDSDDTLWPRKFEAQVRALRERPDCGIAYGFARLWEEGHPPGDKPFKWTGRELPNLFPWLLVDRWWTTASPLYRRSTCDAIGPWSDLRYSEDWEYDARAGALGTRLVHTPEYVADFHHHGGQRETQHGRWLSPSQRGRFFELMLGHARAAGVPQGDSCLRHFSRWAFSHARACARMGEELAARDCLAVALDAADGAKLDMRLYAAASRVLGVRRTATLLERVRGLRNTAHGSRTLAQSWMDP